MQAWYEVAKMFAETGEWTLDGRDDEQDDEDEDDEPGEWVAQPDGSHTFVPAARSEPKNGAG